MIIAITTRAKKEISKRTTPLKVELELYFSCLVRKRVLFLNNAHEDTFPVESDFPNLQIAFRPVMTKACHIGDVNVEDPEVEIFPIVRAERFFPKWMKLDYSRGKWQGDFGYVSN